MAVGFVTGWFGAEKRRPAALRLARVRAKLRCAASGSDADIARAVRAGVRSGVARQRLGLNGESKRSSRSLAPLRLYAEDEREGVGEGVHRVANYVREPLKFGMREPLRIDPEVLSFIEGLSVTELKNGRKVLDVDNADESDEDLEKAAVTVKGESESESDDEVDEAAVDRASFTLALACFLAVMALYYGASVIPKFLFVFNLVPVMPDFFELLGLTVVIAFGYNNVLSPRGRAAFQHGMHEAFKSLIDPSGKRRK